MVLAVLTAAAAPLAADDLLLSGGESRLTGEVRAIDPDGVVELESPLSPEPLQLASGSVRRVSFTSEPREGAVPDGLLELANGDRLPVRVSRMTDGVLHAESPDLGNLAIPRAAVRTLQVGVRELRRLYQGPVSLAEWTEAGGDPRNWDFRAGVLTADGTASAAADLGLPRGFVLKFTLRWSDMPNFQISFADPGPAAEEARDRYYLQFGRAGMEIKRESSKGQRFNTIVVLNRTPDQFPDRRLEVELGVDRGTSRIQLFLNGEPEGTFADPITPLPSGGGVAFFCNTSRGQSQEIQGIEVFEFDNAHRRHHSEDRGDPNVDSLISRDDDRWGGQLLEIAESADGPLFRFLNDFQDKPIELKEDEVSTVFFARDGETPEEEASPYVLKVRGDGELQVRSCRFADGRVEALHPLLGEIRFGKGAVMEMVWKGEGE